jgi:hypothetical protein
MSRFCTWIAAAVFASVTCLLGLPQAGADVLNINPAADGSVQDLDHNGTFDIVDGSELDMRNFDLQSFKLDSRGIAEFSLASVPAGAIIDSATFVFTTNAYTTSTSTVFVDGYIGDGSLTVGDATTPFTPFGSYDAAALGLGQHDFAIPAVFVQSLLPLGVVGLRLSTPLNQGNTQLYSSDFNGLSPPGPLLVLNYRVPEPSSVVLGAMGVVALVTCAWRRRAK